MSNGGFNPTVLILEAYMSDIDYLIIAPNPDNLEQYAVWRSTETHDIFDFLPPSEAFSLRNPFDYSRAPLGVFDTVIDAMLFAKREGDANTVVRFVYKDNLDGYMWYVRDEPSRTSDIYLGMVRSSSERR